MSKNRKLEEEFDIDEDMIYFEDLIPTCFACGHKIDKTSKTCPYCETKF